VTHCLPASLAFWDIHSSCGLWAIQEKAPGYRQQKMEVHCIIRRLAPSSSDSFCALFVAMDACQDSARDPVGLDGIHVR
jgi:hypothetical protein